MRVEIKGKPYNIETNDYGWGVVKLERLTDRFGSSYQVFSGANGAPVSCACPDSTNRGGVCKHMSAVLDMYLGSVDTPCVSLEGDHGAATGG